MEKTNEKDAVGIGRKIHSRKKVEPHHAQVDDAVIPAAETYEKIYRRW